jgi:hypothetical protein
MMSFWRQSSTERSFYPAPLTESLLNTKIPGVLWGTRVLEVTPQESELRTNVGSSQTKQNTMTRRDSLWGFDGASSNFEGKEECFWKGEGWEAGKENTMGTSTHVLCVEGYRTCVMAQ